MKKTNLKKLSLIFVAMCLMLSATVAQTPKNQAHEKSTKYECAYDANGNQTIYTSYEWDSTNNTWIGHYKEESIYDAEGNIIMYLGYGWNNLSNSWILSWRGEYTYCENHITLLEYYWVMNIVWKPCYKTEYTFNNHLPTICVVYLWDIENTAWIEYYNKEYTYNNEILSMVTEYYWDSVNNIFVGHAKEEYIYDEYDSLTIYVSYRWDYLNNVWELYYKQNICMTF